MQAGRVNEQSIYFQWKGINRKQSARWQHLSRLKVSVFFSLQIFFSCYETQQLILGTGTAIRWVTEPHCLRALLSLASLGYSTPNGRTPLCYFITRERCDKKCHSQEFSTKLRQCKLVFTSERKWILSDVSFWFDFSTKKCASHHRLIDDWDVPGSSLEEGNQTEHLGRYGTSYGLYISE